MIVMIIGLVISAAGILNIVEAAFGESTGITAYGNLTLGLVYLWAGLSIIRWKVRKQKRRAQSSPK